MEDGGYMKNMVYTQVGASLFASNIGSEHFIGRLTFPFEEGLI